MEHKFLGKSVFESGFDSFDLDDEFFMKMDSDLRINKISEKQFALLNKCSSKRADKQENALEEIERKDDYYDLPLFIDDLSESDFFDISKKKGRDFSPKVISAFKNEGIKTSCNGFISCLSPVQDTKVSNKMNISTSTPIRLNDNSNSKENTVKNLKNVEEKAKVCDFDFLEADLFDDWNIAEIDKKDKETEKSTVTFSQALKLIEEVESARDSDKEFLNHSIDLLTGELVGADMEDMFEESFDLPKSAEMKCHKEYSSDSSIIIENIQSKAPAVQKSNFDSEEINDESVVLCKENNFRNSYFNSDDDFDFLTQDLLKKPKQVLKCAKSNPNDRDIPKVDNVTLLKDCDLNESTDAVSGLKKKSRKRFNLIDSNTTKDSPSPRFHRQIRVTKTLKNFPRNIAREFIDFEAEVSDIVEVTSDEEEGEGEGEYDKSFLDEESYFSQNCSANMTAKYLQSVKNVKRFGSFKIPAMKPYNPQNIFSQIPEENNTDYEIDSFCVNEVEEDIISDLSDLEVAEKILEMNRKKRKKKNQKFKKFK